MPRNELTISSLINDAVVEITEQKGYSKRTIEYAISTWNQFRKFCISMNYLKYSSEVKEAFIQHLYELNPPLQPKTIKRKTDHMQMFDLFANEQIWHKGNLNPKPRLTEEFEEFINLQEKLLIKHNYSEHSIDSIRKQTTYIFQHFQNQGLSDIKQVEQQHIHSFVLSLKGHARSTLRCELSRLRQIFHNAYLLEATDTDMSCYVPTYNLGQSQSHVKIWNSEEIAKVLETVDKSNPKGLRDAAIITIVSELGMRSRDILNLKLSNFDWEECSVTFIQSKTGKTNTLPINEKTGNAIISYLRIRPHTDCEYLFVSLKPPYEKMKSFNSSFNRYVQRAGITVPANAHHNMHSLRATVATRLLEENVSPDDIFSFLGHSDRESLHNYIRMDIEHLRECALSFEDGEFV